MRKCLIILTLLFFCFGFSSPHHRIIARKNAAVTWIPKDDANCMGAWYMNSDDNETDRSGEGVTLIEEDGEIPTGATVVSGYSGNSRDFESTETEDLVYTESNGNNIDISGADQAISICLWIEEEDGAWGGLVEKSAASNLQYRLYINNTEAAVVFSLSINGSSWTSAIGATDVRDNSDHHICGVYDDTEIIIYIDGSEDSNGADNPKAYTSGIFNGNAKLYVGYSSSLSNYYDGDIDELIIFDRALTPAEVTAIYTNGISGDKGGSD